MALIDRTGLTRKITRERTDAFFRRYRTDALTLDIGCGNDPYAALFPNKKNLEIAPRPGVRVDYVASAEAMPIPDAMFDVILCNAMLEHTPSPVTAVREMRRVLKPGGLLLVTVPFIFPIHDAPGDYWRFTKYGMRELLKEFDIVELEEITSTMETLGAVYQRIGFQCETLGWRPLKALWFIKAKFMMLFSGIITKEYGDIGKKHPEKNILSVGYNVAARKR